MATTLSRSQYDIQSPLWVICRNNYCDIWFSKPVICRIHATSSHGNTVHITGPLSGEFTGHCGLASQKGPIIRNLAMLILLWTRYCANSRVTADLRLNGAYVHVCHKWYPLVIVSNLWINWTDMLCIGCPGVVEYRGNILQWRHNERNGVSNNQRPDCLLNSLFGRRSKKTSKLRVSGLYEGKSPVTGRFSSQRPSNAESVSIWWRHHVTSYCGPDEHLNNLNFILIHLA